MRDNYTISFCCQGDRVGLRVTQWSLMFCVLVFLASAGLFSFSPVSRVVFGHNHQTRSCGFSGNVSSVLVAMVSQRNSEASTEELQYGEVLWPKKVPPPSVPAPPPFVIGDFPFRPPRLSRHWLFFP